MMLRCVTHLYILNFIELRASSNKLRVKELQLAAMTRSLLQYKSATQAGPHSSNTVGLIKKFIQNIFQFINLLNFLVGQHQHLLKRLRFYLQKSRVGKRLQKCRAICRSLPTSAFHCLRQAIK